MQNDWICWVLDYISNVVISLRIFFLDLIISSSYTQCTFWIEDEFYFLFMYSDYFNTEDSHTIIIIAVFFVCIFYVFLMDRSVFSVC
jgi:hypothetical protein